MDPSNTTRLSADGTAHSAADSERDPPTTVNGRYEIIRELGTGGLGTVYLVEDLLRDRRRLALKRLHARSVDATTRETLQNEFLVLSLLRHPGIAEVYDFGRDFRGSDFFFTSAWVDGLELSQHFRSLDIATEDGTRQLLDLVAQILRALEFVHSRGIVHGDLKPENILVEPANPATGSPAQTKRIDFGLVRQEKDFVGRNVMGTLCYIPPEVITGSQIDRRTDLYSLGAVLWVLCAQRPLFDCTTQLSILKSQLEEMPRPPGDYVNGLDPRLDDLIMQLLEKTPARRPRSAAEVIARLSDIAPGGIPLETPDTAAAYFATPRVDSHQRHARALFSACIGGWKRNGSERSRSAEEILCSNRGYVPFLDMKRPASLVSKRAVFLRGEKGIGNEALVQGFKSLVQINGGEFLRVEGGGEREQKNASKHGDFENLLRELVSVERSISTRHHQLDVAGALLRSRLELPEPDDGPALKESLAKLVNYLLYVSLDQPLVIHIDHLERASPALVALVECIVEHRQSVTAPDGRLFLSAWIMEDGLDPGTAAAKFISTLAASDHVATLSLERLDHRETQRLIDTLLAGHDLRETVVRRIATDSDGNPQAVVEILDRLSSGDVLQRTVSGWTIPPGAKGSRFPASLRQELEASITGLSKESLCLGVAYAYLGDGTTLDLAAVFARLDVETIRTALEPLLEHRVLRALPGGEDRYAFRYETAQNLLYNRVPREQRATFHRRAGVLTRNECPEVGQASPENLARHFLLAEDLEQASHYCDLAARKFVKEFRVDRALRMHVDELALAKRKGQIFAPSKRHELAHLLALVGRHEEAHRILAALVRESRADVPEQLLAQTYTDLAELCTRMGEFEDALDWITSALALTRDSADTYKRGQRAIATLARARLRFVQGDYDESSKDCQTARSLVSRGGDSRTLARCLSLLAENYFALGDLSAAAMTCKEALVIFDDEKDSTSREAALYELSRYYKYLDRFSEARAVLLCSIELRGKMGMRDAEAAALSDLGGLALFLGRFREASQVLFRAVELSRHTGDRVALLKALNLLSEALRTTGEYEDAKRTLEEAQKLAKELGSPLGEAEWRMIEARMALDVGDLETAEKIVAETFPTTPSQPRSYLKGLDLRCQIHRHKGDYSSLHALAEEALSVARENRMPLHEARFLEHLGVTHLQLGNRDKTISVAKRLDEVARRYSLPLSRGRALLLEARIAAGENDDVRAALLFDRAKELFLSVTSERDMIRLFTNYGDWLIAREELTTAFCYVEEGLYLARKLQLHYWECRLLVLGAKLTLRSIRTGQHADANDARKQLGRAETLARNGRYANVLWQIQRLQVSLTPGTGSFFVKRR